MSTATCDQWAGTSMPSALKTDEPSVLRISDELFLNSIPAYGSDLRW